ncbi:MAG: hypothetical protein JJE35_05865 [Thermoleophilia bacterium]|nr:hypothetical protein [Thermoleophilia bacterium]
MPGSAGEGVPLSSVSTEELYAQYPHLRDDPEHKITSQRTDRYNCVAWVQGKMDQWFDPEIHWPDGVPEPDGDADLDCYLALFSSWGFEECSSADLEEGYLKIAVFAAGDEFQHVAKQLPSGAWSSKGGPLYDFRHGDLAALRGCRVMPKAELSKIMRRPYDGTDRFEVEEKGLLLPGASAPLPLAIHELPEG